MPWTFKDIRDVAKVKIQEIIDTFDIRRIIRVSRQAMKRALSELDPAGNVVSPKVLEAYYKVLGIASQETIFKHIVAMGKRGVGINNGSIDAYLSALSINEKKELYREILKNTDTIDASKARHKLFKLHSFVTIVIVRLIGNPRLKDRADALPEELMYMTHADQLYCILDEILRYFEKNPV